MARPKKRSKTKKILFAVEIIVLLVFIGGLYVYGQLMSRMDKTNTQKLDTEKIQVNEEVQDAINSEDSHLTGYTTYALFGIDSRSANMKFSGNQNSDTMIIASVNNDTKEVRLVSIYRDTLLNLGDDTYSKANAAYAYGGPEQAITMLNTNLDLNITDYATVKFDALATIIDDLGGLDMDMSYAEIVHMNNYCVETAEDTGLSYTPIELPEKPEDQEKVQYSYHLNGVQATSYCRIRYTASLDMGRTERQRKVIQMIVYKAKHAGLSKIFNIMDDVFPMVTTSLGKEDILQLLPTLIGYSIDETAGFPSSYKFSNVKGSIIVPTDLVSNVQELHKFLYGDANYTPSATVTAGVKLFTQCILHKSIKICISLRHIFTEICLHRCFQHNRNRFVSAIHNHSAECHMSVMETVPANAPVPCFHFLCHHVIIEAFLVILKNTVFFRDPQKSACFLQIIHLYSIQRFHRNYQCTDVFFHIGNAEKFHHPANIVCQQLPRFLLFFRYNDSLSAL